MKEHTLALIKPDAWERRLVGVIIQQIEMRSFTIETMTKRMWSRDLAERFYGNQHKGQPYFEGLITFMSSGPVLALILSDEDAIRRWRQMMGAANPRDRLLGTIRKELGDSDIMRNLVHGSDSRGSFVHESSVLGWHPSLWSG